MTNDNPEPAPREDHLGEEAYRAPADGAVATAADSVPKRDRGLGTDVPDDEKKDSGFYGAGNNDGVNDDNLARETTPGYQADKGERGTIMPR